MCFDFLYNYSEKFLILRRTEWDMMKHINIGFCKVPVILIRFEWNLDLPTDFPKMLKYQIACKSVQWETICSLRKGRRTDMTNPRVAFRNFAKAIHNSTFWPQGALMWFVRISEQIAIISLYTISRPDFTTEMQCVYRAQELYLHTKLKLIFVFNDIVNSSIHGKSKV